MKYTATPTLMMFFYFSFPTEYRLFSAHNKKGRAVSLCQSRVLANPELQQQNAHPSFPCSGYGYTDSTVPEFHWKKLLVFRSEQHFFSFQMSSLQGLNIASFRCLRLNIAPKENFVNPSIATPARQPETGRRSPRFHRFFTPIIAGTPSDMTAKVQNNEKNREFIANPLFFPLSGIILWKSLP